MDDRLAASDRHPPIGDGVERHPTSGHRRHSAADPPGGYTETIEGRRHLPVATKRHPSAAARCFAPCSKLDAHARAGEMLLPPIEHGDDAGHTSDCESICSQRSATSRQPYENMNMKHEEFDPITMTKDGSVVWKRYDGVDPS